MSHLDTAYKLGSLQAQHDFQAELQKTALGNIDFGDQSSQIAGVNPAVGQQSAVANAQGTGNVTSGGAAFKPPMRELPTTDLKSALIQGRQNPMGSRASLGVGTLRRPG